MSNVKFKKLAIFYYLNREELLKSCQNYDPLSGNIKKSLVLDKVWKERRCEHCQRAFRKPTGLKRHMRRYHEDEIRKKFKRVTYSHRQYRRDVRDDSDEDDEDFDLDDLNCNEDEPRTKRPVRSCRRKIQSFCRSSWRRIMRLPDFQPKLVLTNIYKTKNSTFDLPELPEGRETPYASDEEIVLSDAESEKKVEPSGSRPKARRKWVSGDRNSSGKAFDHGSDTEIDVDASSENEEVDIEGTPQVKEIFSEDEIIALDVDSECETPPKDYEEMSVDDILDTLHKYPAKIECKEKEEQPLTPISVKRSQPRNLDLNWKKPVPVQVEVDMTVSDVEDDEDEEENLNVEGAYSNDIKPFKVQESVFYDEPEDAQTVIDLT